MLAYEKHGRDARSRCYQDAGSLLKEMELFRKSDRFSELVLEGLARHDRR